MDPVTIGLGLAGLGMQLFGGFDQASVSKQQAQISSQVASVSGQIAQDELQVQAQKQQQMQLEYNRQNLQNFRNVQQARARSLANATNQNAQFGTGLQGGLAEASDVGNVNALGLSQNLQIGQNIFGIDTDISQKKIQIAGLQSQSALLGGRAATDQGLQSLGGALLKTGPIIGAFSKNLGAIGTNPGGPYI